MFYNKLFLLSMAFLLLVHDGVQARHFGMLNATDSKTFSFYVKKFGGHLSPITLNFHVLVNVIQIKLLRGHSSLWIHFDK